MNLSGNPLDYLVAFAAGIAVSFTPCIFPLLPISVAYIGINSSINRARGLCLAIAYTLGLAVTYSLLGLIASLTGSFLGRISSHPFTLIVVGLAIVFFGVSMLDFFTLGFSFSLRRPPHKKGNLFSAFVLGLSSGLIISPCLTPVLSSIMLILVAKKNILYGMSLLFSFACGIGLTLMLAGTFSSCLFNLLKPGRWLNGVKKGCALVLIALGIYFIYSGISRF